MSRKMQELEENFTVDINVTGILCWVIKYYTPDEVFDEGVLKEWALANGFMEAPNE